MTNLTKNELKILRYLANGKMSDDARVARTCGLGIEEAQMAIDDLRSKKLIGGGGRTNELRWSHIKIGGLGEEFLQKHDSVWWRKIDWKYCITTLIAIAALAISITALNK